MASFEEIKLLALSYFANLQIMDIRRCIFKINHYEISRGEHTLCKNCLLQSRVQFSSKTRFFHVDLFYTCSTSSLQKCLCFEVRKPTEAKNCCNNSSLQKGHIAWTNWFFDKWMSEETYYATLPQPTLQKLC